MNLGLKVNKYSGKRDILASVIYKLFKLNINHIKKINSDKQCTHCKSKKKIFYFSKTIPDFNVNILPKYLFDKFYLRSLGKCQSCGLIQDYNTMNEIELENYEKIIKSKDLATSEEVWNFFPIPENIKKERYEKYYKKRFKKWSEKLEIDQNIKNILFLRPGMGTIIKYFKSYTSANLYFLDISDIAIKTVIKDFPNVIMLDGKIHGIYRGDFLKMKKKFDLIINEHNLVHCFNIDDTFEKLKSLLSKNGKIIFIDEIIVKTTSPFHINFWDEDTFVKILRKHFLKVEIIRHSGIDTNEFKELSVITNYTKFNDNPDFVASIPEQ